ncbi:MAG: hypothetical protein ACLRMJ_03130 [Alistipes finegoldii]
MNGRDYLLTLRPAIAEGYCGGADPLSILDGAESAGAGNSAASRWTTRYLNPGESLPKGYKWIEDGEPRQDHRFPRQRPAEPVVRRRLLAELLHRRERRRRNIRYAASAGIRTTAASAWLRDSPLHLPRQHLVQGDQTPDGDHDLRLFEIERQMLDGARSTSAIR